MIHKTVKGIRIPALGLGTFELTGDSGVAAIRTAIEHGYRHIDTAARYGNEAEVGQAIRDSGVPRDELFVTTKVWFDKLAPDQIRQSVAESLDRLQMDAVDLLLVHWPTREVPLADTLATFAEMRDSGSTRSIGVSNFTIPLLAEAVDTCGADLVVNQVEYHPYLAQDKLLADARRRDMLLTAYQPIARGEVFQDPTITRIGEAHGKSAAQVTLRWLVQQDNVAAIPRSSRPENIRANLDIFDFELSDAEMAEIAALDRQDRKSDFDWAPDWDRP